jgi:hypothetical protein
VASVPTSTAANPLTAEPAERHDEFLNLDENDRCEGCEFDPRYCICLPVPRRERPAPGTPGYEVD